LPYSPYFSPTLAVFVVLTGLLLKARKQSALRLFGSCRCLSSGYKSGGNEFPPADLQKAGVFKTILILPVMNLIRCGAICAFVNGGAKGFSEF